MLVYDAPQTQYVIGRSVRESFFPKPGELQPAHTDAAVDPFVQSMVAMTSGQLYAPIVGKLTRHPIPSLRLPESNGAFLLDVGCNWGRWTIAASRLGYEAVGIDPSLQAILAASRVAKKEGSAARFVVGDARFLPFAESSTDVVFSYSVLQHFSDADVMMALREFARVLRPGGRSLVQMANSAGVRSFYHQAARRMREAKNFEVRYRSTTKLREMFRLIIGESVISADGYFGLGVQPNDIDLLPRRYRAVVVASEWIRRLSLSVPGLTTFADSVYVDSIKSRRVTSDV
jgi:ubiquinone/menaquinone biosynthesis C-methylase UbiE